MLELGFLLISIIIIICVIYINTENYTENYTDYYLSSCPSGYKTFYNDGDVEVAKKKWEWFDNETKKSNWDDTFGK